MDVTIDYTGEQMKQQMLTALTSRMSGMKFKKSITADDVKLFVATCDNPHEHKPLDNIKIIITIPE